MIISSIWIGDRLSKMERLCIQSYLQFGHTFRLYCYAVPEGTPEGVQVMDASKILPESRIFRSSNGAVGDFANYFKYLVLRDQGGCWTEMDEVCLRPWDDLGYFISSEWNKGGGLTIDQAAINIEAHHPLMVSLVEKCEKRLLDDAPLEWGTFGVESFDREVRAQGLLQRVKIPEMFCPLPWWEAPSLCGSNDIEIPEGAFGIQTWNEAWRRGGWDKDSAPPGSPYERLFENVYTRGVGNMSLVDLAKRDGMYWGKGNYFDEAESALKWQWPAYVEPVIGNLKYRKVIDLGAGHGRNAVKLAEKAKRVLCVDINPENVGFMRRRFERLPKFEVMLGDGVSLPEVARSTDLVYSFDSMVHFPSTVVYAYLEEISRVLKPGGHAFLHYSNLLCGDEDIRKNPHWRAIMPFHFRKSAEACGLEEVSSAPVDWDGVGMLDRIALLRKA